MAQIGVVPDAVDAWRHGKRRVHQDDSGPDVVQPVRDGFGVEGGDGRPGKKQPEEPRPGPGVFVEIQLADGARAQGAFRHHRQHAGAGRRLQHGIAGPDGGSLEGGIGERQRGRELLQADLVLGALRVRGLQRRDGLQHRQHAARPVRPGAGVPAHRAAVALQEEHRGGFGGLIGVLPEPGARGVRRAEGPGHGVPEDRGIERPARLEGRQQGPGRREQGIALDRFGLRCRLVDGDGRKRRTRERVRRRMGVEHGQSPCWKGPGPRIAVRGKRKARGAARVLPRFPAGLPPAGWPS